MTDLSDTITRAALAVFTIWGATCLLAGLVEVVARIRGRL